MDSFQDLLGRGAGDALCNVLGVYNAALPLLTTVALLEPTPVGEVVLGTSALAVMAMQYGCPWDPNSPGPTGPQPVKGCKEYSVGGGPLMQMPQGNRLESYVSGFYVEPGSLPNEGSFSYWDVWIQKGQGRPYELLVQNYTLTAAEFLQIVGADGSVCGEVFPPAPPPAPPTHIYNDPETGCTLSVDFLGFAKSPGDLVSPVWQIEPAGGSRTGGGIIGGCNFSPVVYYGGPGGPGGPSGPSGPTIIPVPDPVPPAPPDQPWWKGLLEAGLRGIVAGATEEVIENLLNPIYEPTMYSLTAVCDKDAEGELERYKYVFPRQSYQDRMMEWQIAHAEMQQADISWATRTCSGGKPELFLHWRSLLFQSDEPSDSGDRPLVKRLRYRGSSPGDLVGLADHWDDFEWDTGDVVVYHKGSPVGTPQVWAASVDEGKRVLRHAFGEAGIDPDQVGEWGVSSSDHPRYGVSRRVKLKKIKDCWYLSSRPDPNGLPERPIRSFDP